MDPAEQFDGLLGHVIEGRYRVLGRVGAGGMGVVYRVQHTRMGKIAAMKVLRRDLVGDAQAAKRFALEAEAVSRLDHPNIVQTFDFGEWRGLLYLVMEFIRGEDLATVVRREGPMPAGRALPLFNQVLSALGEAHAQGIVHRDMKPDNLLLVRRPGEPEAVKVLDFGLAKLREPTNLAETTNPTSLVGTPHYMAPEQIRNEPIDGRADLYSVGASLYRVLTGAPPFPGDTVLAIISRHLTDDVKPPSQLQPDLPLDVDHLVLRAMAKNRDNRYATAQEMRADLERAYVAATGHESASIPTWIDAPLPLPAADAGKILGSESITERSMPDLGLIDRETDRLRREDVDDFERRLRRRHLALMIGVPLLALALGASAWRVLTSTPPAPIGETESEPNNSAATANRIASGRGIVGRVGEPAGDGTPDIDYYLVPASERRAIEATVSALPDLDLVLELFDHAGVLLARADGGQVGAGEVLGPLLVDRGEAFVRVRPVWEIGRPPVASGTPYSLTVTWGPPAADFELEPNDDPARANAVALGAVVRGRLAGPDDRDAFRLQGPPGTAVTGEVSGVPGVDLTVAVGPAGAVADAGRAGAGESFSGVLGEDGALVIVIAEKKPGKGAGGDRARPRRDHAYELRAF